MEVLMNKTLTKYLKGLILIFGWIILNSTDASATHIVGGDITYKKTGVNTFTIILSLRRDSKIINGVEQNEPFDNKAVISQYRRLANGSYEFVRTHELNKEGETPVEESIDSKCEFEGTQINYKTTTYEFENINLLLNQNGDYIFVYQRCCRNGTINNIVNPLETGTTFTVSIPQEAWSTKGNSSPYFTEWPNVYVCGGLDLNYLTKAVDVDGDSLSFKLCTPKIGFTKQKPIYSGSNPNTPPPHTDLTWQAPYNLNNLMGGTPLKIDAVSGLMTAKPLAIEGQYVIGICVEEWRNGKKIGEIRRDFQYNVRICTTPPTALYEAPDKVCDVKTVNFTNNSLASNSYSWNFNFPSNDPQFQSSAFSPTFTFPANGTYDVRLIVVRGSDECSDTLTKSIRLTDLPYNADFEYDILSCNADGSSTVTLTDNSTTPDTGQVSTSWLWTLNQGGTLQTSTTNPGIFTINPEDFAVNFKVGASNACRGEIDKPVDFEEKVLKTDFIVELDGCDDSGNFKIKLIDLSQSLNDNYIVTESNWTVTTSTGTIVVSGNPAIITAPRASFSVALGINTNKQCRAAISKDFNITDFLPTADFNFELVGCDQSFLPIIKLTENSNDNTQYSTVQSYTWNVGGTTYTGQNVEITTQLKDIINPKLTLIFANTCSVNIDKIIDVNEIRPKVEYDYVALDCPTDNTVRIEFGFNDKDVNGVNNTGINWNIGPFSDVKFYTGNTVIVTLPKDSLITGAVYAAFENGCRDIVSKQFLPGPYATLHLINDSLTLCPNEITTIFIDRNPDFTYTWTPNTGISFTDSTFVLNPSVDANYTVLVSDKLLCSVEGQISIDVLESININIEGPQNTCDGTVDLQALGAVGPGVYEWSTTPNFAQIIFVGEKLDTQFTTDSQTYYVRFRGEVCSANDALIKVVNQTPQLEVLSPSRLCIGDTIKTLNVINANGTHNLIVNWNANPHLISGGNTLTPTVGTIGENDTDFTLSFTTTNQFNCPYEDSVKFIIRENPIADFDFSVTSCDSFKVCFTFKENQNDPTFGLPIWAFGDSSPDVINLEQLCHFYPDSGSYKVVLKNFSNLCPFADVEKIIDLGLRTTSSVNNAEDCINSDYTLQLPDGAGENGFTWTDIFGNTISTDPNPKVNINSDTTFLLNIIDENGCDYDDTFNIKAFVFDFNLTVPDTVCEKGLYQINTSTSGGFEYLYTWGPSNAIVSGGNTGNPTVDVSKASSYIVTVTYPTLGCATTGNVEFTQFVFTHELILPDLFCQGTTADASIEVEGTPNFIYQWSPTNLIVSGANTSNIVLNVIDETEIKVLVTHPTLGCTLRDSFPVDAVNLVIETEAEPNTEVPKGKIVDIFIVDPETGNTYTWSNNFVGTTQKVTVVSDTSFSVTVTDNNGCSGTSEVRLKIRPPICEQDVFIPTAFSPNGDNANNTLYVRSNYISDMELVIYNRWGQEVFASKDITRGWDGKLNGQELAPDTYAYWLRAKCSDGEDIIKRGSISLLR